HVSGNTELAISESFEKSAMAVQGRAETTYFSVNYDGNGVDHMNINIVELAASGLKAGDEIAVFDNDVCVGAIRLTDQDFALDAVSIPASASEEGLNNGYLEGNSINLKARSNSSNEELTMSVSIIEGEM